MKYLKRTLMVLLCLSVVGVPVQAKDWELKIKVQHRSQQEDWSCGPNTIAMWAGYIRKTSYDTSQIAKKYTGVKSGTTIPEFMSTMYSLTPWGYVFTEWEYNNKYTAIKGIMYGIARFNEPVAIAGNDGNHYYLVVGGVASRDPYKDYGTASVIKYLYLHDSREGSPLYTKPKRFSKYWTSIQLNPIFKKGTRYTPNEVLRSWTKIGSVFDKKWRSIERNTTGVWKLQGATSENKTKFSRF
jgi:hypothetical protein